MTTGIYKITNLVTNKVYIGQSVNIERRWAEHKARAFDSHNNCFHLPLYRSIRKHGLNSFQFEILCRCSEEELNMKEAEYIQQYNSIIPNGYNILSSSDKRNNPKVVRRCTKCNIPIDKHGKFGLCSACYRFSTRTVERPSREELKKLIRTMPFTKIGEKFGVTDNSIRKWCDTEGLPRQKKIINSFSEEEWNNI